MEFNPADRIKEQIERTDSIIRYLMELQRDVAPDYVEALIRRLLSEVKGYTVDTKSFSLKPFDKELSYLKQDELLTNLIIRYMAKNLALPEKSKIKSETAKFTNLNRAKAMEGLSYFRVKAFADILGKEEGIKLYSRILGFIVKEMNSTMKVNEDVTVKSRSGNAVKRWCKEGVGDFTFTFIDVDQILYRFDKCVTHEALKDYNDPDIAYIASCFIGDIDEFNEGNLIHLRRTQTLHHGNFCDELYWDTRVHTNPPVQPTLEFTKKLEKR